MDVYGTFKTPKGTELPLLNFKGKPYLTVPYRVLWFREERPAYSIETQFIEMTDKMATAKATIKDETGRVLCTAHKTEDTAGFKDFKEKAETGAVGRALAYLGFGTQFAIPDLDEEHRIVDAPVTVPGGKITAKQAGLLRYEATKAGLSAEDGKSLLWELAGVYELEEVPATRMNALLGAIQASNKKSVLKGETSAREKTH